MSYPVDRVASWVIEAREKTQGVPIPMAWGADRVPANIEWMVELAPGETVLPTHVHHVTISSLDPKGIVDAIKKAMRR